MNKPKPRKQQNAELLLSYMEEWIVEPIRKTITAEVKKLESRFVHLRLGVKADIEEMQNEFRDRLDGIDASLERIARELARKAGSDKTDEDDKVR